MKDVDELTLDELLDLAHERKWVTEYELGDESVRLQLEDGSVTMKYPFATVFLRGLVLTKLAEDEAEPGGHASP